jgi:hypothetical protein
MRKFILWTMAVIGLTTGISALASATSALHPTYREAAARSLTVEKVNYYRHHRHWRHRHWDRRHHHWHYY